MFDTLGERNAFLRDAVRRPVPCSAGLDGKCRSGELFRFIAYNIYGKSLGIAPFQDSLDIVESSSADVLGSIADISDDCSADV